MTIALHEDVLAILKEEATSLGVTLEEAANFLIRFGTCHKPLVVERQMLIFDSSGKRIYDYEKAYHNNLQSAGSTPELGLEI